MQLSYGARVVSEVPQVEELSRVSQVLLKRFERDSPLNSVEVVFLMVTLLFLEELRGVLPKRKGEVFPIRVPVSVIPRSFSPKTFPWMERISSPVSWALV